MKRTRETKRAAAGSRGSSGALLMAGHIETVAVAAAQSGERLDRVLAGHFGAEGGAVALSRTRLKALILAGEVAIDGRTIRDPGHRVNAGDVILVNVPPAEEAVPQP
jgi:23S rRNA pseudouridine1911/1915/1917 synthase